MKLNKVGRGLINSVIDKLPFEIHLPGYQYCGPGTKLQKRLTRGDRGINQLDASCKVHDIAYDTYKGDKERRAADKILSSEAWKRVTSNDAGIGERTAALAVATTMKAKIGLSKIGNGLKKRVCQKNKNRSKNKKNIRKVGKCTFKKMIDHTKKALKIAKPRSADHIIDTALVAAKNVGQSRTVSKPRIIPLPRTGGVLPLVPIFAGLSALGSLVGGSANIVRAIKSTNDGRKALKSGQTGIVKVGKSKTGEGLYLKPYKHGYGLYLKPYPNTKN